MNSSKKTATMVGVLYIIGTVTGVLSVLFTGSILDGPDYLVNISANANQVVLGSLLVLTMGLALAVVPVVAFPVLREQNETLALGYVIFRGAIETVTYIAVIGLCSLGSSRKREVASEFCSERSIRGGDWVGWLFHIQAIALKGIPV
jgi:hypothetical protein